MDDVVCIVKVGPGIDELVAGPTIRVGLAVVGRKTKNIGALVTDANHPQKYSANAKPSAKAARMHAPGRQPLIRLAGKYTAAPNYPLQGPRDPGKLGAESLSALRLRMQDNSAISER